MPAEASRTVLMNFQNKAGKTLIRIQIGLKKFPTSIINPYLLTWHHYQQCLAGGHNHVFSEAPEYLLYCWYLTNEAPFNKMDQVYSQYV